MIQANHRQTGRPIRILLVDNHSVMREGLASLLETEKDLVVVAQAADGRAAINSAMETKPDIILMDISMPEMDGIQATIEIRKNQPDTRVIGLSMYDDSIMHDKVIAAGASAYMYKATPAQELIEMIRSVALSKRTDAL